MKAKEYNVLEMAVERGIEYGYMRAHKHNESPSENEIKQAICRAVMDDISEWFVFDDLYGDKE